MDTGDYELGTADLIASDRSVPDSKSLPGRGGITAPSLDHPDYTHRPYTRQGKDFHRT